MKKCKQCNEKIIKGDYRKKFCNHSCSAIFSNIKRGYKIRIGIKCKCAGKKEYESEMCRQCRNNEKNNEFLKRTIESFIKSRKGYFTHQMEGIRKHARKVLGQSTKLKMCEKCGWDKYVQACHKIPIYKFPKTTKVEEVNNIDNLMWLCPNDHWLYDQKIPQ